MVKEKEIENEVINSEIVSEPETTLDASVREDLNCIVKNAKFEEVKTKYGTRYPFYVTLFNDTKLEFTDSDGLCELLLSYKNCGKKDFIKFKGLVEEVKLNEEGKVEKKYICFKYVLSDDTTYRLFARKYSYNKIIDNYYENYKSLKI